MAPSRARPPRFASAERLVIIGAGPAGLAAATAAQSMAPLVIEAGVDTAERSQSDASQLVQGVGGAGLYSDGKFSYWPSASSLWELDHDLVREAYEWFRQQMKAVGIETPDEKKTVRNQSGTSESGEKRYLSRYASPAARLALIRNLSALPRKIATNTVAESFAQRNGVWSIGLNDGERVDATNIVIATGRFGPLLVERCLPLECRRLLRLEVGVRIQQPSDAFFLAQHPQLDPKFIWRNADQTVEWRTFCCCREGMVVWTRFGELGSASGRADCDPTGLSNIGFNVRLLKPVEIESSWKRVADMGAQLAGPIHEQLGGFLEHEDRNEPSPLRDFLGPILSRLLAQGLDRLGQEFPDAHLAEATLVGPTIEGCGWYPRHSATLATPAQGIWTAGDAAGSFRGLTAALVSGYLAGAAASRGRQM